MTLRFTWLRPRPALPAGDRVWPVLGVLLGLLAGATTLEVVAARTEPPPLVVEIGQSGTDDDGEDDDTAVLSETPALNGAHARARALALRGQREQAVELFARVVEQFPQDASLHAEYGFWLLRTQHPKQAQAQLDLATKLQPKDPRIAFKQGLVLARLGDEKGAEAAYRRALSLHSAYDRARVALGNLLARHGSYDQAVDTLRPAAARGDNQDRARALVALGRAELGRGAFDRAEQAFARAIERAPSHAEMRLRIGRAWLKSQRLEDVARAVGMMRSAKALAPEAPAVYSALAQALERAGEDTEAERAYEEALRLDPHYVFVRKRLLHRALDRDDTKRALSHAERLVAEDETRAEYHFLLGLVTARTRHQDEARKHYQAAIERDHGRYPEAWLNLGRLEATAGDLEAAAKAYRRALETRPKYAAAFNNLGLVLEDLGDLEDAEKAFRSAIELRPEYASARVNLGTLLSRQRRLDAAIDELKEAIRIHGGDYPSAELNLSVVYLRKKDPKQAEEICTELLKRRPRYVAAWYDLGLALRDSNDVEGATRAFRRALEIDPDHRASIRHLADLELAGGDPKSALDLYQDLVDRDGSDAEARLLVATLERQLGDRTACARELRVAQMSAPDTAAKGDPSVLCSDSSPLHAKP